MNQIVVILQNIAQTAYKTQETVKTIASYPEASNSPCVYKLYMLLEEIKTNSIKSTIEIIVQTNKMELKENIHIIYKSMGSGEETHKMFKNAFPQSIPESTKSLLDANMQSLKRLLVQMAPHIVRIYGESESLSVVTPDFQSLVGIKRQY